MKIHIRRNLGQSLETEVYLYEDQNSVRGAVMYFYTVGKNGKLEGMTKIQDGNVDLSDIKPTFVVDEFTLREILAAFSKEAKGHGIHADQAFSEGKLEATEKHLEDMRALIFNKGKRN